MLAMALWMVAPVLPGLVQMLLWAALLLGYGCYLLRGRAAHWAGHGRWASSASCSARPSWSGVASGGRDPLAPLARICAAARRRSSWPSRASRPSTSSTPRWRATGGKTAMLDFYADWCVSCKEMEKLTFVDPAVQGAAGQHRAAAGGRDRQRCGRPGDAEALRPVRAAGHHPVRPRRARKSPIAG